MLLSFPMHDMASILILSSLSLIYSRTSSLISTVFLSAHILILLYYYFPSLLSFIYQREALVQVWNITIYNILHLLPPNGICFIFNTLVSLPYHREKKTFSYVAITQGIPAILGPFSVYNTSKISLLKCLLTWTL